MGPELKLTIQEYRNDVNYVNARRLVFMHRIRLIERLFAILRLFLVNKAIRLIGSNSTTLFARPIKYLCMKHEQFSIPIGKKERLACFLALPEAKTFPLLITIHGFSSSHLSSKADHLRKILPERGWAVLSFDLRNHGESSGQIEDIRVDRNVEDVRVMYQYAKKNIKGVETISLFGSSYGGMLAIILAIEQPDIALLGLQAPVTDFAEQRGITMTKEGLKQWKKQKYYERLCADGKKHKIKYDFYESMLPYHEKIYALTPKIKSNTFIVQGDKDESVPLELTEKFFDALTAERELVIVPGADHQFSDPVQWRNMMRRFVDFFSV